MPPFQNIANQRFGRLTVTETYIFCNKRRYWVCICDCGNQIEVRIDGLKCGDYVSCGCHNKENNQYKGSQMHPRWNNDASNGNVKLRETPEGKEWRKQVYKLYNYKCVICGHKSTNLNAHHLYSFHSYPTLRNDVSNGVCLCKSCHRDFHNRYGIFDNTKEQFNEYYKINQII